MRGVGGGVGGPPLRDHLWQGPPLPVTLRLIHPPPKMTQGGNDPLTPLHRLSTASLNGVVRAFAYHRYFRFFLSLFFSTALKRIFPDSGVPYPLVSTVGFAIFAICGPRGRLTALNEGRPVRKSINQAGYAP